jgi:hypothetical protein
VFFFSQRGSFVLFVSVLLSQLESLLFLSIPDGLLQLPRVPQLGYGQQRRCDGGLAHA